MSYSITDISNKTIGDGPCINGLREMKEFVSAQGQEKFPATSQLFEYGHTKLLVQLGIECRNLAKRSKDQQDIRNSFLALGKATAKAKELLVLED